ncbi:MAG: hypothetical protein Q8R02_00730 [Hyphomonadaceae bacterium]|nr:hypothetical protein [Hyphomonadaceae bacterium]
MTVAALIALAAPAAWADTAGVERTFLERSAIAQADVSCNLFSEGERLALKSGLYQSEGELLRANYSRAKLTRLSNEVRAHAKALGCDHPSVLEVAATIRSSYRQFAKTIYLEYASANSTWGASRSEHDKWAVMHIDKASGAIVGLRRGDEFSDLKLAVSVPADGRPPSAVQLFMRNADKMSDPWLGQLFGATQLAPAPRSISRPEWAGDMEQDTDSTGRPYYVFFFSPAAIERLEKMDPRESVSLELTPSPMSKAKEPTKIPIEVGDFRAAHVFALIPKPAVSALAAAEPAAAGGH